MSEQSLSHNARSGQTSLSHAVATLQQLTTLVDELHGLPHIALHVTQQFDGQGKSKIILNQIEISGQGAFSLDQIEGDLMDMLDAIKFLHYILGLALKYGVRALHLPNEFLPVVQHERH